MSWKKKIASFEIVKIQESEFIYFKENKTRIFKQALPQRDSFLKLREATGNTLQVPRESVFIFRGKKKKKKIATDTRNPQGSSSSKVATEHSGPKVKQAFINKWIV